MTQLGDLIYSILTNIIMLPITFFCGMIFTCLKQKFRIKHIWKNLIKFNIDDTNNKISIITANTPDDHRFDGNEKVTLGYTYEYMGSALLIGAIKQIYKNKAEISINMQFQSPKRNLKDNLVLFGGPVHNPLTKQVFFGSLENKPLIEVPFHFKDFTLVNELNGEIYDALSQGEYYGEDYALIINTNNPWNKNKRVIGILGCRSVGCYGAAMFLSKQSNQHKNFKKYKGSYLAVIKCESDETGLIDDPTVIYHAEFNN